MRAVTRAILAMIEPAGVDEMDPSTAGHYRLEHYRDEHPIPLQEWSDHAVARRPRAHHRIGWSLVIATLANVLLGLTAIATGATLVGVVACTALALASWVLVLAEVACRYGFEASGRR